MVEEEKEELKEEVKEPLKEEVKKEVKVEKVDPVEEVNKKDTEIVTVPIPPVSSPVDDPVKNLEIQLENTKLIDYFEKVKQEEERIKQDILNKENEIKQIDQKKEQEQQEQQALIIEEEKEISNQLIEENREYQQRVISLLEEMNSDNYKAILKNDSFNTKTLNEITSIHNSIYVFLGIFIAAFVVLVFSKTWGVHNV